MLSSLLSPVTSQGILAPYCFINYINHLDFLNGVSVLPSSRIYKMILCNSLSWYSIIEKYSRTREGDTCMYTLTLLR
jgi:hypothetical protein